MRSAGHGGFDSFALYSEHSQIKVMISMMDIRGGQGGCASRELTLYGIGSTRASVMTMSMIPMSMKHTCSSLLNTALFSMCMEGKNE